MANHNCAGGSHNDRSCCGTEATHPPALVTNKPAPYSADVAGQQFNIPQVTVSQGVNSITVTVGGVPYTLNAPTIASDVFLSSGDYNETTGNLELTMSNGTVVMIPIGVGLKKCDGSILNPTTDRLVACSDFAAQLCTAIGGLLSNGVAPNGTEFIGKDCRTYTINAHVPAVITNNATPFVFNPATQTANIPAVTAATGAGAITVTVGGVPVTFTETPLTVTDTPTVDFSVGGTSGHALTAAVKVSSAVGNQIAVNADGLFVPGICAMLNLVDTAADIAVPVGADIVYVRADGSCGRAPLAGVAETPITAVPSPSVIITPSGVNGHTLTATVVISPQAGNAVTNPGNGLYVPSICAQFTNLDTATDTSVPVTAEVTYIRADGSCGRAPLPAGLVETPLNVNDTPTIDFTVSGTSNHTLTGAVKVSATAGNAILVNNDGLFVAPICAQLGNTDTLTDLQVPGTADVVYVRTDGSCGRAPLPTIAAPGVVTVDSASVDFTGLGTAGNQLTATVIISPNAGNQLSLVASGLFVPSLCAQMTALNTTADIFVPDTADLIYVRADGSCGRAPNLVWVDSPTIEYNVPSLNNITGTVKIDNAGTNAVTIGATGLYVPNFCTAANAVDTATDANVPATADVLYVRADGTCGRAPLSAVVAGGITTATDTTSIDFTVTGNNITGVVIKDPLTTNALAINAAGVYVPNWCTQYKALPTAAFDDTLTTQIVQVTAAGACSRVEFPAVTPAICSPEFRALTPSGWQPVRNRHVVVTANAGDSWNPNGADIVLARGNITINNPTNCPNNIEVINVHPTGQDITITLDLNGVSDVMTLIGYANPLYIPTFGTTSGSMRQGETVELIWTGTTYVAH